MVIDAGTAMLLADTGGEAGEVGIRCRDADDPLTTTEMTGRSCA